MSHNFAFFRVGGFNQVRLETGADLLNLDQLDQKLWVALACPTQGLEFDARTLALIDNDGDGRIRANELIAAIKWAGRLLQDPDELVRAPSVLRLAAINTDSDDGKQLLQAVTTVLQGLGKPDADAISVAETAEALTAFNAMPFNGDGVLTLEAAESAETSLLMYEIMQSVGSVADVSGKNGIDQGKVAEFEQAITAWLDWHRQAQAIDGVLPLQQDNVAALAALTAVRAKIDDYFARCQLAAFDRRAIAALNREEKEYYAMAAQDLVITAEEIRRLPLAQIAASPALPLRSGLNPAWQAAMTEFDTRVVKPLLGDKSQLTESDWQDLKARLGRFENWYGSKPSGDIEKLGLDRLQALAAVKVESRLAPLFAQDQARQGMAAVIASVERLARYVRDLHQLTLNFVSFQQFYSRKSPAIFQVGTLYLDQRAAELCLRVEDAGKHTAMAALARSYLVYCECERKVSGDKMTIVAAFTDGDADNMMVGRNGIFYSRDGRDWDATVIKIIESSISLRQAFWSPYKKLVRFIEEQVAKRAAAADAASGTLLTSTVNKVGTAAASGDGGGVAPKKLDIGVVAALGVAVGGITAAMGALLQAFFGLGLWMPLGVVGLLLLISGPSMLIAWLKLRQRNIGPLLEANGWAINGNARINVPFGASLTRMAALPKGASLNLRDPFADKKTRWGWWLVVIVVLAALLWYWQRTAVFAM